jgi:hypothetical protein
MSKNANDLCDINVVYLNKDETFDPTGCQGTETLLMNSIFGADTEIGSPAINFPSGYTTSLYSRFGMRMYITAKDLEFGFGVGEDLTWLLSGGPVGYLTSNTLSKDLQSRFRFDVVNKNTKYSNAATGNAQLLDDWTSTPYPGIRLGTEVEPLTVRLKASNDGLPDISGHGISFI